MKPILVILNPYAGVRRGNRVLADILDIFCRGGLTPIVRTTQAQGDGLRLAAHYAGRVDRIVCIGGDGTFNEVVSGVLRSGRPTPIGYIPAGSTNDFAVSLGLSRRLLQAAKDIVCGVPVPCDVGRFNERYFTYTASFGAFTRASYATRQSAKNTFGHLAYLVSAARAIPEIHSTAVSMTADGARIEGEFLFGGVCNSTSMGGVLRLDPRQVDLHDGLFELLLVHRSEDRRLIGDCVRALLTQKYDNELLELHKVRRLTVTTDQSMDWTLDGERGEGGRTVEIEVLPGAVELLMDRRNEREPAP